MEEQAVADSASSVVTALLEYGAMGIFAIYLIVPTGLLKSALTR
jgi:hypothetical protein